MIAFGTIANVVTRGRIVPDKGLMNNAPLQSDIDRVSVRIPGFVIAFFTILVAISELFRTLPGSWLGDLGTFIESGYAGRVGGNPYDVFPLSLHLVFPGFEFWNQNLNPPISVLFFSLFTFAKPEVVFRQWYIISFVLYSLLVWAMLCYFPRVPRRGLVLWMGALAPFWDTLMLGQVYIPLGGIAIAAWLMLEKRKDILAGILIGLFISIKPQFLLWPLMLLLARHFVPALSAFITSAVVAAIPLGIYGLRIYEQWLDVLIRGVDSRVQFPTNVSMPGLFSRLGMYHFGLTIGVVLCLLLCAWAMRVKPDRMKVSSFALVLGLLALPLAWIHYCIVLVPLLLSRWHNEEFRFSAFVFCIPVPLILHVLGNPGWIQFTLGGMYNWALILLFVLLILEEYEVWVAGRFVNLDTAA